MLYLSITFDYELFFGDNYGSYDEVLFSPTYGLIDFLKKRDVSATFFADVCSVPVSIKYGQHSYSDGFKKQIIYLLKNGQDVQLHLHPHWFGSKYEDDKWSFSADGYRLGEYDSEQIESIVSDGVKYLNDTLNPVDGKYSCIAYRAGGFSIQPQEQIIKALYNNGIRIDSSIAPGLYADTGALYYDYRHKLSEINWHVSCNSQWWEDDNAEISLLEIPVATIDKSPVAFAVKRLFQPSKLFKNLGATRGSFIPGKSIDNSLLKKIYRNLYGVNAISMDTFSADYLFYQVKRLQKKVRENDAFVALIGHPKLVNDIYISNLSKFIEMVNTVDDVEFVSIKDAYLKMCIKD